MMLFDGLFLDGLFQCMGQFLSRKAISNRLRPSQSDREHCDVASIMYQATSWDKPRRVVILRRLDINPEERLCADWLWEYKAIATTFDWSGEDGWHLYNFRGHAENHIKEAKYGFAIDQFCSQNSDANKALQGLELPAYNLLLL
ncbi:transposase [Alicyclobacillus ferrooxydans]|uniref:Transposase DDE domain-containing protein n=1 Tax=Alicyclobacillus ferrooxydans TaxID=471514 RepID=A0A0P9CH27_9BACL|nr:transposase [Alicyclobacillus ferrooxydans]KPV45057.1 hypothetical protein AN477_04125 [Alicyclobacillus ferrooxydans]